MLSLFILGIAVLLGIFMISRWYVSAPPKTLAKALKWIVFTAVVVVLAWLALSGRLWAALAALPAIFVWFMRLFTGWRYAQMFSRVFGQGKSGRGWSTPGGAGGAANGQSSDVHTRFVRMTLDHASGHVSGTVLDGRFSGRTLESLSLSELIDLYAEAQNDPDSVRVIESYLDRRDPNWRTHDNARTGASDGGAGHHQDRQGGGTTMSREEALDILGLDKNATADAIKAAHRRLMANLHPDKGGSTYLAQQINCAKDILLKK